MNFFGFLEELPEILAAARSKKPEDTGVLEKKLFDINRDRDVEEITIVGHSRGALVVDHSADTEPLVDGRFGYTRVISVESPGVYGLKVKNLNYVEYISSFSSIINAFGTSASPKPIMIKNTDGIKRGKDFLHHSFDLHGMDSMHKNFSEQFPLEGRISCFSESYASFIKQGGVSTIRSTMAVEAANAIKGMSLVPRVATNLLLNCIRPNSYSPSSLFSGFDEDVCYDYVLPIGCALMESWL